MSTKHTHGPWVRLRGSYATSIVDSEHRPICVVYKQGDALLIEAAPDLLDAGTDLLEYLDAYADFDDLGRRRVAALRVAIAKARGFPPVRADKGGRP